MCFFSIYSFISFRNVQLLIIFSYAIAYFKLVNTRLYGKLMSSVNMAEAYQGTFELTVDLHARSAIVEETGVVVISVSVDAIELGLGYVLVRVLGRQLDPRFRLITRLRARFDWLNVVLRDEGSLAIF